MNSTGFDAFDICEGKWQIRACIPNLNKKWAEAKMPLTLTIALLSHCRNICKIRHLSAHLVQSVPMGAQ